MLAFEIEALFFFLVESDIDFGNVQYMLFVFSGGKGVEVLIQRDSARIKFHSTFCVHRDKPKIDFECKETGLSSK